MTNSTERHQKMVDALQLLQSALNLLDQADAPGTIGGHVDLALHQLREALAPIDSRRQSVGCH